ncbi:MAG: methyl-accepting chemotaxis protein [Halapricum sp.]
MGIRELVPEVIRRRYAVKFGIVILVIGLSLGVVGVGATSLMGEEVEDSINRELESTATSDAQSLDNWLEQNAIEMQSTARYVPTNGSDSIDSFLSTYRHDVSEGSTLTLVHVVDPSTNTIENSSRVAFRGERFDADEVGWAREPDFNVSGIGVSELYVAEDSYYAVAFSTELDNGNLLVAVHDVEDLGSDILGGGNNPETDAFTVVIDSENRIVMSDMTSAETAPLVGQQYPADSPVLESARALPARTTSESRIVSGSRLPDDIRAAGSDHLVGYAPSGKRVHPDFESDWVVAVHIPTDQAYGFAGTLREYGLYATGFGVIIAGLIGAVVGRNTAHSITGLTERVKEIEEGDLDTDFSTPRIDEIGQLYAGFDSMQEQLKARISEVESARKEAEVARSEAEELAKHLQEKAAEYSRVMQQVSNSDLTQRMEPDHLEDSMNQIATEFNEMIEEIEKTVGQLQSYVDEVETAGREVENSAETVRTASEQVADSIQQISDDAYRQTEQIDAVTASLNETVEMLESLTSDLDDERLEDSLANLRTVADEVNQLRELTEATMSESETVAGAAEEQAAELNEVSSRANDLQRYASPLREILEEFDTEAEHEFVFSSDVGSGPSPAKTERED